MTQHTGTRQAGAVFLAMLALTLFTVGPAVGTATPAHAAAAAPARTALAPVAAPTPPATATVTISPTSTTRGGTVTITAAGFQAGETVNIYISGQRTKVTSGTATVTGNLAPLQVVVPSTLALGPHTVTLWGTKSNHHAYGSLTVATAPPSVTVAPTTTNLGGLITISGTNFTAYEPITISIQGVITPLAKLSADAHGLLPPTGVSIPYGIAAGAHVIEATGGKSHRAATASITVNALTPSIALSAASISPGGTITVTGKGFGRQERVTLALNGEALTTSPAAITTTVDGAFTATVTAPNSLLRGANALGAIGNASRVSAVATLNGVLPIATTLYYAGGSTAAGAQTTMSILNTNPQPTLVTMTFYYQTGVASTAPTTTSVQVPGHSQSTVNVTNIVGADRTFGIKLAADRTVTAQMRVDRAGKDGYGLLGVPAPSTTWYLAEGYTGLTFHETLSLVNPGATPAVVQVQLLPFAGYRARTVPVTVAPGTTALLDVNRLMPGRSLSVITNSNQPIVVARILSFSNGGFGMTAKMGSNGPATSWIFAEGTTTTRFQTFLTVLNPNTTPVRVTASFYGQNGQNLGSRTITVIGLTRANIKLNDFLHASGIASVVTSDLPIFVERPEYFGGPNAPNVAGSDVFGRNGVGLSWTFPGGNTASLNEYLLIYNPSPTTVQIDATVFGSDGRVSTKRIAVPPTVRYNLNVNTFAVGATPQHGIVLRAANGQGFVAEQTIFAPDYSSLSSTQGFAQ